MNDSITQYILGSLYFQVCRTNKYDNTTHERGMKDKMTVHRTISSCQKHTEYPRKSRTSMHEKRQPTPSRTTLIGMAVGVVETSSQNIS